RPHPHPPPAPRRGARPPAPGPAALSSVDVTLHAGEILGLVGESGSGKSTLLRRLMGLEPGGSGEVTIAGLPLAVEARAGGGALRAIRRKIQMVFQDPVGSFDPRWTVDRIVAEPLGLEDPRPGREEIRRRVHAALEAVGMADAAGRLPHQFSGGQRQRIAIARALVVDPAILVLDEATSALDAAIKIQILDLLAGLVGKRGLALLFATHDLALIRRFADRIMVMKDGAVVESGPASRLFGQPRHPYTRQLLAASPDLDEALAGRRPDDGPPAARAQA
ncbi:MAG: ABC transporter ATP-binding protein, partial [Telmatospirillum sp.]|nr:ABC transporter ATP-binding protein [Telmatospirillum sp.]